MTNQRLHLVGLGCARNDVDSEELAARFDQAGFDLVDRPDQAEVIVVNTCGFIAAAKQDSIDQILAAADWKQSGPAQAVIATGCLAERYGAELAAALPEADAVVGFDGYADIAATVTAVLEGRPAPSHQPRDRRLLPLIAPSPSAHTGSTTSPAGPGTVAAASKSATANTTVTVDSAATPLATATLAPEPTRSPLRRRLETGPSAALKIASGCDRRCAFCAIPQFRGRFQSRPADDIVAEARWLAEQGVRELVLVSENSTAYGKDLGTQPTGERSAALTSLLSRLSQVDGIDWLRLLYLQPAELTPALIAAVATTPKVVPYIDLPVQHASPRLLRRMRRFGGGDRFLTLLDQIRQARPEMAIRTNVIVGFPGETEAEVTELTDFLGAANFDAIGVFGYSDEEGTEAADLDGHLDEAEIRARVEAVTTVADVIMADRAERWRGQTVDLLIEGRDQDRWFGRTPYQGPETDPMTWLEAAAGAASTRLPTDRADQADQGTVGDPVALSLAVGTIVPVEILQTDGVDLIAQLVVDQPGGGVGQSQ